MTTLTTASAEAMRPGATGWARLVRRRRRAGVLFARHVLLVIAAVVFFGPFLWMVLTSLKSASGALAYPPTFLPTHWHFANYLKVFQAAPFGHFYLVSIVAAVGSTVGQVVTSALAGYAFARLKFRGSNILFVLMLGALLVPFQVVFVPLVHLLSDLNWLNSYQGLIVPNIPSIFGAFLFRQFFIAFPAEIEDASRVDGCSVWRRFIFIVLPLSRSVASAFAILSFIYNWNNFFYQFIIVNTEKFMTVQLGLVLFQSQQTKSEFNLLMAASALAVVPVVVVFLIFQRQIVRGVMLGGFK